MQIDLTKLNYSIENKIDIKDEITFSKEEIKKADLIDLKNVKINGYIIKDSLDDYILKLKVNGIMVLPCSRTLKPTEYNFTSEIEEKILENEENFKKSKKTIDILPIIWENILMEIPIRIVNPDAEDIEIRGDGWELITDSENKGHNSLAKLKDLL